MKCKCMPRCATAAAVSEEQLSAASRASVLVKFLKLPREKYTQIFLIHPICNRDRYHSGLVRGPSHGTEIAARAAARQREILSLVSATRWSLFAIFYS